MNWIVFEANNGDIIWLEDGKEINVTNLVKRDTPKKPREASGFMPDDNQMMKFRRDDICPKCWMILSKVFHPVEKKVKPSFCPFCGQAIDWSDKE